MFDKFSKKCSSKRAISPALSTVIMTGAMIAILSVALVFANNLLWSKVAEGDFDSSKQLMQSVGLQIDDVAWTIGRTETIRYASQYGDVEFEQDVLNYTINVTVGEFVHSYNYSTGVLMFNIPTYRYSISDDYWTKIFPETDGTITLKGTSAPVARVFAIERTPMPDGKYIRVVVAPSIRVLNSSIATGPIEDQDKTLYIRMYLPVINVTDSPRLSQSITLTGESLTAYTRNNVDVIKVTVSFPKGDASFDSDFFRFPGDNPESFDFTGCTEYDNVVLELYVSEVSVGFGVN